MADTAHLHHALLRPAILHILRAAGFHSTKPSTLDTLTDLSARYFLLLAQRTAEFASERGTISHQDPTEDTPPAESLSGEQPSTETQAIGREEPTSIPIPTLPDVLAALNSTAAFNNTLTPSEEAWRETLRRPLSSFPEGAAREKERRRRDAEDTKDIREFVDWCTGPVAKESRRIAGLESKDGDAAAQIQHVVGITAATKGAAGASAGHDGKEKPQERDDYVTLMKKKYSRTGDGARYAGTVLGRHGRDAADELNKAEVRIEGPEDYPSSLKAWKETAKKRRLDVAVAEGSRLGRVGTSRTMSIAATELG